MIDPKSLRIGNYFRWSNGASVGRGIGQIKFGSDIDRYPQFKEPIPLSEQELIRLGFEKEGLLNYTRYRHRNPDALFSFGNYARPKDDPESKPTLKVSGLDGQPNQVSITELKYVHQLQNLYYSLTGTELTYKVENETIKP